MYDKLHKTYCSNQNQERNIISKLDFPPVFIIDAFFSELERKKAIWQNETAFSFWNPLILCPASWSITWWNAELQIRVDIERVGADIERTWVDIERIRVDIERIRVDIERIRVDIELIWVDIERIRVDIDRVRIWSQEKNRIRIRTWSSRKHNIDVYVDWIRIRAPRKARILP